MRLDDARARSCAQTPLRLTEAGSRTRRWKPASWWSILPARRGRIAITRRRCRSRPRRWQPSLPPRSGAPAGEPVYRIIGCRQFYGLELDCVAGDARAAPGYRGAGRRDAAASSSRPARARASAASSISAPAPAPSRSPCRAGPSASPSASTSREGALVTACANARRLGVAERFTPLQSDWFTTSPVASTSSSRTRPIFRPA